MAPTLSEAMLVSGFCGLRKINCRRQRNAKTPAMVSPAFSFAKR